MKRRMALSPQQVTTQIVPAPNPPILPMDPHELAGLWMPCSAISIASGVEVIDCAQWTNHGPTLYVVGGYVWTGVDATRKADISFQLWFPTRGYPICIVNDDHYLDRGGLPQNTWSLFSPPTGTYYAIRTGDMIELFTIAVGPYDGVATPINAITAFMLYYTTAPPV